MDYIKMNKWHNFYKNRLNPSYFGYLKNRYRPFILTILKNSHKGDKVIELGCGTSNITKILYQSFPYANYKVQDINKKMLCLSQRNLNNLFIYHSENNMIVDVQEGDLCHSHGVLEHFNDAEIKQTISLQLNNYKTLIHYVPSYKYKNPSFGDERLMTGEKWFDICNPTEITEFNDGHDLILIWKK